MVYLRTGHAGPMWLPLLFYYVGIPLLDWVMGRDTSNPPKDVAALLEQDLYYRAVTWMIVPFTYLTWVFLLWFGASHPLPWWAYPPLIMGTGSIGGFCINVAHEMGHRSERVERWLTKLVLAPSAYGHFTIDHNRGHHREVATFDDHASARMGESTRSRYANCRARSLGRGNSKRNVAAAKDKASGPGTTIFSRPCASQHCYGPA